MNKYEFLAAVREGLGGIDKSDIDKSLDYYREMIDDRMDDGITEEEAVAALCPVDKVIAEIRAGARAATEEAEAPSPVSKEADTEPEKHDYKPEPEKIAPRSEETESRRGERSTTEILDGLIKRFGGVFCVALNICFWCAAVGMLVAGISAGVATAALFFSAFVMLFTGQSTQFLFMLGGALCCAGIGILLTLGTTAAIRAYRPFAAKLRSAVGGK